MNENEKRVKTGCPDLDKMLDGGLLPGSAVLLEGAAGTGKTTLGIQFLMKGMRQGESALVVTFEEFPEQYYDCAMEMGWDLRKMEEEGLLEIIFTTPDEFIQMIDKEDKRLVEVLETRKVSRAIIDSITNLEKITEDIGELRTVESTVVNYFKRENITCMLLKENGSILGGWSISKNKISFIVDCYIILRYLELESEIKRALMVLKMRGSNHDKTIREYQIEDRGLDLKKAFKDISGIFLGTAVPRKS